jgi:predicted TIM-barrel fold metal-dependent hydrolase
MIIDTESHVIYRVFPIESNPDQPLTFRATWHEHSGDLFAAEMDRAGVDYAFLISYDAEDILWYLTMEGAGLEDCVGGRKYTLESGVKKHPDKFLWFATLKDPRRPDAIERMQRDLADGALGMKIFPAYHQLQADDPSLVTVYREIVERDRRVILSFEDTKPPETPTVTQYFEQLDRVLTELPELKVQINHAGAGDPSDPASDPLNPEAEAIFRVVDRHDNVRLSTSWLSKNWDDGSEYPFPNYLRRLERLKDGVGVEKLFWATDWPWLEMHMTYPQAVDSIRRHATFFTDAEKEAFLGGNAFQFVEELLPAYEQAPIFASDHAAV